jgi:cell division initiation protein
MDTPQPSQTTLETLRTVEFRLGLKGYNVDEVDEYLEKAAVEAEAMQEQLRQAQERLRQASERIAQLEQERREQPAQVAAPAAEAVSDDTLQRTLLMAQRFVDQTKRESEAEAAAVVAQAEGRARTVLAQAEERARQMATESEHRLREEVTRLEGLRGQLASDVENMARHLESERTRLRAALAEVLKWVDDNVQPAASLMAMRPRQGDAPRPAGATATNGDGLGTSEASGEAQVLDLRSTNPGEQA